MLTRLIEIEKRKVPDGDVSGLSPERLLLLKQRLLNEKETIVASFDKSPSMQAARKFSGMKTWIYAGIAAMLILGIGLYLLPAKFRELDTRIVFSKGNSNNLAAGTVLLNNSNVSTNSDAIMLLQQGDHVKTLIGQNSRFKVQKILLQHGKLDIELFHESGLLYCSVERGQADLKIITPGAQVRVVGTRFSVQTNDQVTQVAVLEGTVQVIPHKKTGQAETDKIHSVSSGQVLHVSAKNGDITERLQTKSEVEFLNKMQEFVLLPKDNSEIQRNTLAESILAAQNRGEVPNPGVKLTLADIRKKYGRISRVNLKNGKSYVGFFTLRGPQIQIITVSGPVRFSSDLLKDVRDAE
jgi:hypothetical protein